MYYNYFINNILILGLLNQQIISKFLQDSFGQYFVGTELKFAINTVTFSCSNAISSTCITLHFPIFGGFLMYKYVYNVVSYISLLQYSAKTLRLKFPKLCLMLQNCDWIFYFLFQALWYKLHVQCCTVISLNHEQPLYFDP